MVQTENLDLSPADAEQLDLFYLVDCVLDELEQAKKASTVDEPYSPDIGQIMPAVIEEYFATDTMDPIECPLRSYDHRDQYYSCYDGPYSTSLLYQTPYNPSIPHQSQNGPILPDLIDDVDAEYLNHVDKCGDQHSESESGRIYTQPVSSPCGGSMQDDYVTSSPRSDSKIEIKSLKNQDNKSYGSEKDYIQNCQELNKYSDLIKFPEMTSSVSSPTSATSTSAQSPYQQRTLMNQNNDSYDEDSADTNEIMSWTLKHPENWSCAEVLDWLYSSAERHGVDCSELRGEAFRTVNGERLCTMTLTDFTTIEPMYGRLFYDLLREQVVKAKFPPALNSYNYGAGQEFDMDQGYVQNPTPYNNDSLATSPCDNRLLTSPCGNGSVSSSNTVSPNQLSSHTSPEAYSQYPQWRDPVNGNPHLIHHPSNMNDLAQAQYVPQHPSYSYGYQGCPPYTARPHYGKPKSDARDKYDVNGVPRRRPGRPRIKSIPTEEELAAQREKKLKSQHLWEFIYEMLSNPLYNPSILKWENQNEGVFRFVQSEAVAQLWGTLKSNENMTYEKLSRAMRHYYKRGILERVEGRRLVYKFSLGTLDRLQQKKLQLVEMTAAKFNFASRDKGLNNGQYGMAAQIKDPNCGQYGLTNTNIPNHEASNLGHGPYSEYDQGLKPTPYALASPVSKHDAETGSVVKTLDGSAYNSSSHDKSMENSAYMMPNPHRDYGYTQIE